MLIRELLRLLRDANVPFWLRGGWALDFLLGRVTRRHGDIDVLVWAADASRLADVLVAHGYEELEGGTLERQRNFMKAGEELHATLLERGRLGDVLIATFRGAPLPQGAFDHPPGQIGDLVVPIISPEAQLWAKESLPRLVGDAPRKHDPQDIQLLREALAR